MVEFFNMGGYAAFVWGAYGVAFIGMVALGVRSWRAMKTNEAEAKALREKVRGGGENGA